MARVDAVDWVRDIGGCERKGEGLRVGRGERFLGI